MQNKVKQLIVPKRLGHGDEIRIIAPSYSSSIISKVNKQIAKDQLEKLGFKVTFGFHSEEIDEFNSSSVEARINDLHDAFKNKNVKGILTAIGGYNCNQLLEQIDWEIIKSNPKVFCGFSDITVLNNAILSQTGLITYSGPHFSTFAQKKGFDYTMNYFKSAILSTSKISILPSEVWSDDTWWENQEDRLFSKNHGYWVLNKGSGQGHIVGGSLSSFVLLLGSKYLPMFKDIILFLEDDQESSAQLFDRYLEAITYSDLSNHIRGVVIGRFQKKSNITEDILRKMLQSKVRLNSVPLIANVDFGHTDPKCTFPIGGTARLLLSENNSVIINNRTYE